MDDAQRASQSIESFRSGVTDDGPNYAASSAASVRGTAEGVGVNLPLDNDTRKLVVQWAAQQGVPTILLFCILGFLAYSMVVLIPEVDKKRSEEIAERISGLVERQNEAIVRMVESHDKDRELFIQLMRDQLPTAPKPTEDYKKWTCLYCLRFVRRRRRRHPSSIRRRFRPREMV
jgi:hypothetical protein